MTNPILNPDTQAILLLCGRFGKADPPSAKPLSVGEYSCLAQWLLDQNLRPADLLEPDGLAPLSAFEHKKVTPERLQILLNRGGAMALMVEAWTNKGLWILSRGDPDYPKPLKARLKQAAPPLLYGAGPKHLLNKGGLGIVGSRNVDQAGQEFAQEVAAICADLETAVISGGARGVDQIAMHTALEKGGTVIGVLAKSLGQAALSQKYRQALRSERLVLTSPYYPEAGFSVGGAMARNKYIYVLSDACLVVAADTSGGTWSGAVENLKQRWVPLLVRAGQDIPPGNTRLLEQGANPITLEDLAQAPAGLQTWLGQFPRPPAPEPTPAQASLWDQEPALVAETKPTYAPEPAGRPPLPADPLAPLDLFEVVWPYLAQALQEPRRPDDLAEQFNLRPAQIKAWLEKGLAQEKLEKLTRPVRYVLTSTPDSPEHETGDLNER